MQITCKLFFHSRITSNKICFILFHFFFFSNREKHTENDLKECKKKKKSRNKKKNRYIKKMYLYTHTCKAGLLKTY